MTTSTAHSATEPSPLAPAGPADPGGSEMDAGVGPIETPSGKGHRDENFPVGSVLLPARLRPHVLRYYRFARAIDDIADNPAATAAEKIARLNRMEAVLLGHSDDDRCPSALALRETLRALSITPAVGTDLISAFRQDAVKHRYADWAELIDYCQHSAAPVGRFLIDAHGEDPAAYPASDALCHALQVLNHLQDAIDDLAALDRCYLPEDWLAAEGASVADLRRSVATPALRRVIDRCLDGVDGLMRTAQTLPWGLRDRRFAMEAATIVRLALRLTALLRRGDPVAGRVALGKADFARCALGGIGDGLFGRRLGTARPRAGEGTDERTATGAGGPGGPS